MDVWSNTNMINFVGWLVANTLKVPASKLNIHPMYVGGSFGSKHVLGKVIGIAGMLAKRTGRAGEVHGGPGRQPARLREPRVRPLLRRRAGRRQRRHLQELRIKVVDDYGAYFQFGHGTHGNALAQVTGPYRIGELRVQACSAS